MSSPAWSQYTHFSSRSPSVDTASDDERTLLSDTDLELAQEKQLLSNRSSISDFEGENEDLGSAFISRSKYRSRRFSYVLRSLPRRSLFVLTVAITTLLLASSLIVSTSLRDRLCSLRASAVNQPPIDTHTSEHLEGGIWPPTVDVGLGGTTELCDICDCAAQPGFYAPKPEAAQYAPRPDIATLFPGEDTVNRDEYMRQSILDIFCGRQHMTTAQTTRLVRRTAGHLEQMISWNVSGLDFNKPTIYLTTNTSPNGKANQLRPQYFRRHARTILDWQASQSQTGNASDWQVLWIIVEDELDIDPKVIETLRRVGVPYVYYAYGPTNVLGHAQRNAALQLVYTLTQTRQRGGIFGHGPVYCLDDDNRIAPGLFPLLTRVERIGVFPVGNFGVKGGYEKPTVSPIGEVMGSNSPWPNRTYPFDNAGFAFNSSLLGTQISGPTFWKWNLFGGESEFISQAVSDIRHLEPLCGHDEKQDCRVAWHNEPLVAIEMLTDEAEDDYINHVGWGWYQARLIDELRTRAWLRGY